MASTTSNTSIIVQGQVRFYNTDKKFGFVEVTLPDVGVTRVFFHQSACRDVEGTPEEPSFTERRSDKAPAWWQGCRNPEEIILRIVTGPKGPMASVWGYRPKRNWLESLQHRKALQVYTNGCLKLSWSKREYGRVHREVEGRLQATPILEPTGGPEDPWRLTLEYDVYDGAYRVYDPPTRRETTTVMLERWDDYVDGKRIHGLGIAHRDVQQQEWLYIALTPADHWHGWEPGNHYDSPYKHQS